MNLTHDNPQFQLQESVKLYLNLTSFLIKRGFKNLIRNGNIQNADECLNGVLKVLETMREIISDEEGQNLFLNANAGLGRKFNRNPPIIDQTLGPELRKLFEEPLIERVPYEDIIQFDDFKRSKTISLDSSKSGFKEFNATYNANDCSNLTDGMHDIRTNSSSLAENTLEYLERQMQRVKDEIQREIDEHDAENFQPIAVGDKTFDEVQANFDPFSSLIEREESSDDYGNISMPEWARDEEELKRLTKEQKELNKENEMSNLFGDVEPIDLDELLANLIPISADTSGFGSRPSSKLSSN